MQRIVLAVLFLGFAIWTNPVYADRISELEVQVKMMEEQIKAMKTEINSLKSGAEVEVEVEKPMLVEKEGLPSEALAEAGIKFNLKGQYRVMANYSNFGWHAASISDDQDKGSFFNQRFRTWLDITVNENVGAYLETEIGHIAWGENYEWTKTYIGPGAAPGGDRVGIELRRGYLTYQNDWLGRVKAGIQDWSDSFGDVLASSLWDFNVGGVNYKRIIAGLCNAALSLGVFSMWEGDVSKANDDTILFTSDIDFPILQESSIGLSLYYLSDGDNYSYPTIEAYDSSWDLWLGLRGKTKLGPILTDGFIIYNTGERDNPDFEHQGFAAKLQGSFQLGPAKARLQGLYATGEDDPNDTDSSEFRTVAQSERDNFGAQGYWSYLALTSPRGSSDVQDLGVGLQNRGLGLTTIQGSLEFPIFKRVVNS